MADFATIYATDLVYVAGCWQLCGDAHCCTFSRHKQRFKLIAQSPGQELPLLPGEYEHLQGQGWLAQFQDHEHRVVPYTFGPGRELKIESIVSRRPGCACQHATRPTICRLYPVFPEFDVEGRLVSIDRVGIYDMLESMDGDAPICQVGTIPLPELSKLLTVTDAIAKSPVSLFYMMAYQLAHAHVRDRLLVLDAARRAKLLAKAQVAAASAAGMGDAEPPRTSFFSLFEGALLRGQLLDTPALHGSLNTLADRFEERYGAAFSLAG